MNNLNNDQIPTRTCPICKKAAVENNEFFPFCSKQCKMIDLGKWADEGYRISRPIEQADLEEQ